MTFLELCQMTARQSGTIEGNYPTTVVGQVRRLQQIVEYVNEAYLDIQNAHAKWRWLNSEFYGDTVPSQTRYSGTDFSDQGTLAAITRFSQWNFTHDGSEQSLTMYLASAGNGDEGPLRWLDWETFYATQLRGPQTPAKPQYFSLTNDEKLILSPPPDDIYTLRGKYRKSSQILALDADIPEIPVQFHTIIKDAGLCYIEGFDEGPRIPLYRLRMLPNWSMLEAHQLPKVTWGEPLA
jgi:hypothetical protein